MPKISLDNLERYHGHLKDWCDARFAERKVHENWHEIGPSGAVSFYPVSNRPIDPVVNFAFTETLPEGTKGPDNPSTITGVSSIKVTRCGKNLLAFPYYSSSFTNNGVTFTVASDGTVSTSGTASGDVDFYIASSSNGPWLSSGLSYTLSGCPSGGSTNTYYMRHSAYPTEVDTGSSATFTASASGKPAQPIIIRIKSGTNVNNLVFRPQLELSSTATSFEPYSGTDYTMNFGDTYYGGSVDLSTGIMTATQFAVVYDGTENWAEDSQHENRFFLAWPANKNGIWNAYNFTSCSHFTQNNDITVNNTFSLSNYYAYFVMQGNLANFKSFLVTQYSNGTPVTLVYKLITPFTVQLSPLQIYSLSQPNPYSPNTVYSDQQSVLVRYPKSPIVTGSELDNAILSLGGD